MFYYGECPKCGATRAAYNEYNDSFYCRMCGHQEKVEDYKERLRNKMPTVSKQRMREGTQDKCKTMYKGYEVVDGDKIIIPITEYDRLMEEIK